MSKFANAFSGLSGGNSELPADYVKIDWDKVNQEQVDLFGTQDKPRSRVGIISGIIDLGIQEVAPGHKKSEISLEEEEDYLKDNPTNWFEDFTNSKTKQTERHVFWPQKPQRAVAITVDFPQFEYDWGGEIGKKPLRFLLNGEFIPKGGKGSDVTVGRTYDLKETTKDFAPRWSLVTNSLLYKLAVATEVIKVGEPFTKADIGKLIGKAALFEARLWMEGGYKQEKISYKGEVPEGISVPEYDESILYYISLDSENDPEHVKQLRRSVKNTIKRSVSYAGSKLQEQYGDVIEQVNTAKAQSEVAQQEKSSAQVNADVVESQESEGFDDFHSDIPF